MSDLHLIISGKLLEEINAEREKQISLGFVSDHDDCHTDGELTWAAICYATTGDVFIPVKSYDSKKGIIYTFQSPWPFDNEIPVIGYNQNDPKRKKNLIKSVAMLIAEIERIDRL